MKRTDNDRTSPLLLPPIGLGTRLLLGEECSRVVEEAITIGYRYIDTAPIYENEAAVGEGLRRSGIARQSIFVTTKVERDDLRREAIQRSVEKSLIALKLDYVDLLLIHWPNVEIPLTESIAAMCALQRRGSIKRIGVANFPIALLDEAIELARRHDASIAANQIEIHPSLPQAKMIDACRRRGVSAIAYSPLGRDDLKHPVVLAVASRLNRSPSQVILRWHRCLGVLPIPIPNAGTREQIAEHYASLDCELSASDVTNLSGLSPHTRSFNPAWAPEWDPMV